MSDTVLTAVGNRTADPRKDGETLFIRCVAWRDLAENGAESLSEGARVPARGRLRQREHEISEGERRPHTEIEVDECGPSLWSATAFVRRSRRTPSTSSSERSRNGDH